MSDDGAEGRQRGRLKVAIVGTGMAGLVAAHRLSREDVEVHLFERGAQLGLDANSISVPADGEDGGDLRVDVPMRSFNAGEFRCYPLLLALRESLT